MCGQNAAKIMMWVIKGFNLVTVLSRRRISGDLGVPNTSR